MCNFRVGGRSDPAYLVASYPLCHKERRPKSLFGAKKDSSRAGLRFRYEPDKIAYPADGLRNQDRLDLLILSSDEKRFTLYELRDEKSPFQAAKNIGVLASRNYLDGIATGNMEYSTMFWNELKTYKRPYWMTEMPYKSDLGWKDGLPKDESAVKSEKGEGALARLVRLNQGALNGIGGRLHFALVYGDCSAWVLGQIVNPGYRESAGFPVIQQVYRGKRDEGKR